MFVGPLSIQTHVARALHSLLVFVARHHDGDIVDDVEVKAELVSPEPLFSREGAALLFEVPPQVLGAVLSCEFSVFLLSSLLLAIPDDYHQGPQCDYHDDSDADESESQFKVHRNLPAPVGACLSPLMNQSGAVARELISRVEDNQASCPVLALYHILSKNAS